jgi:hypothetical protein
VLHFSDCQAGAAPGCVAGDNANAGTQASPKRDLSGLDLNAAGTFRFHAAGAWSGVTWHLTGNAARVFEAYGTGPGPLLSTRGNIANAAIEFGAYSSPVANVTMRGLIFDGGNTVLWGLWLRNSFQNILFDHITVRRYSGLGLHLNGDGQNVTLRDSLVEDNASMGLLGRASQLTISGNTFRRNNSSGSNFDHAIYLGSSAIVSRNVIVRGNLFDRNSVVGGTCTGGNFTMHGQFDGVLIENNRIVQDASTGHCWGISMTPAYDSAEFFRNAVIRSNTIEGLGCAICVGAAPGVVIERNTIRRAGAVGISIPAIPPGPGDDADAAAVVQLNSLCATAGTAVVIPVGSTTSGNTVSSTCP